ncbi:50S ribosomal protein L29 [bacterium]|nr:50S ribosomal protein L29 [bacterium]
MKAKELRQKSKDELEKLLSDLQDKIRRLRFDIQLKHFKNVRLLRKTKKDIARILTILNLEK